MIEPLKRQVMSETAYNVGGESPSTSKTLNSSPEWKYHVFLSFAGKDTRLNFTGHLYEAFKRSDIRCFMDDVHLRRGEDIDSLFRAIEDSFCVVLVISQNYIKSTWCLDKLHKILESQEKSGRRVFPIFYNVNPADVRHQRESFGVAFAELEEKFKENPTKVQSWRTDLTTIGNLSGWVTWDKHEADLTKNIVGGVHSFLSTKLPSFDDNLIGIDSKVADVIPFLEIGLDDKRLVGIWGMAGVGKTTLARVVFEKLSDKFEVCCFLEKVRDVLSKEGLSSLHNSLLSSLQIKDLEIYDNYGGVQMIRRHLCEKKVLLVLDDIEDISQLKDLAESLDWFGKGTTIIITTRDRHVLTSIGVERVYEVKTMKNDESLQIFSKKAFNKNRPEEKYLQYSKSLVEYAGGLPLALQALGSYFCGRSEEAVWRDVLDKLKQSNPHKNILQVLQINYDGLDEKEQTIFLDIVCLFQRWKKAEVTQILKSCDLNPVIGIKVLIEKTLLVETEGGNLDMHDLYENLGRNIIQQKYGDKRLQKFGEIKDVLEKNTGFGSGEIEAIVYGNKYWSKDKIEVHPKAFSHMWRLRLLLLNCPPKVPWGLKKLSSALKFVRWPSFPLKALPFPLDELVHIEMPKSKIKQLWNGIRSMNYLKLIDLNRSRNFTETPDFSLVQSLGHLYLSWCGALVKVHESLGVLKELVEVDLQGCGNLDSLPNKLETNSLRKLNLSWCKNVKMLPEFGEGMKKLEYLDASHTGITKLPESIGSLTGLRELNLSATSLYDLPIDCFSGLFGLVLLSLRDCDWLESLPRLPPRLIRLEAGGCFSLKRLLDEQILNLVTSLDHDCRGQTNYVIADKEEEHMPRPYERVYYSPFELKGVEPEDLPLRNFFAIMPSGGKIPSWFDSNIRYLEQARSKCEIVVDVPPYFCASKWSGIVVCLYIKRYKGFIRWSSKAPEDDGYNIWEELPRGIGSLYGDGLCVMVLEFNQKTCWQHLRGNNNSLHIQLSFDKYPMIVEGDRNIVDILGCGWRVMCKEDVQKWCHPNHFNQFTQPQHAPPSEVTLPRQVLQRLIGISVKPRMMSAHNFKNLNKKNARNSNNMVL